MAANQTDSSRLQQRYVTKFLVAEKGKPCEIFTEECVMYEEKIYFYKKKLFPRELNIDLLLWALVEKTVHGIEVYRLSGKEKIQGAATSKKGHADSILGHKRINV